MCWDWLPGEKPNWAGTMRMQGPRGYLRAWAPMEGTNPPTRAQWPLMGPWAWDLLHRACGWHLS